MASFNQDQLNQASRKLRVLTRRFRFKIIELVQEHEGCTAQQISQELRLDMNAVLPFLYVLTRYDVLVYEKKGSVIIYSLNEEVLFNMTEIINSLVSIYDESNCCNSMALHFPKSTDKN